MLKNNTKALGDEPIRIPYFDWDKAKHFYYVAKLESITKAAQFLNISQPSLSRKIQDLENRLNCRLFVRTPTGLEITRKGEEFFAIIERTVVDLKGFTYNSITNSSNGNRRKIRISTTHAIATYILAQCIIAYNELNPAVIFEIITDENFIDLAINDVDIAIQPILEHAKDAEQKPLFTLHQKLFASTKYIEKYGEPNFVNELKEHHVISYPQLGKHPYSDPNWILKLGMPQGEIKIPEFTTDSLEVAVLAAQNGIGIIGCYEQMSIIKNSGLKHIIPDAIAAPLECHFIYHKTFRKDLEIKKLFNYLQLNILS